MAEPILLDLAGLRERLDNEDELVKELAEHFLERAPEQLAAVAAAATLADAKALEYSAHSFKSALAIFGADVAVATAQALEDLGHAGRTDGALEKITVLSGLVKRLEQEITTIVLGRSA